MRMDKTVIKTFLKGFLRLTVIFVIGISTGIPHMAGEETGKGKAFFPVSVWYAGGKARAPMLEKFTPEKRDGWRKDLQQIKMNRQKYNSPESDIIFEPDSQDFFNSPWTRLQQRHHIDLEPTHSSVEESEFRNEIQNYLKKGGKITKLSVGFCSSPINMELT